MSFPAAWLRRAAEERPDETAVRLPGVSLSCRAFAADIDELARRLAGFADAAGQALAVQSSDAFLLARLSLAAPRAGMPLLPINPKLAPEQFLPLLDDAGVGLLIADRPPIGASMLCRKPAELACADPAGDLPEVSADDIQLIIATSGSTGRPKGVMLRGRNLAAAVVASRRALPIGPGDAWLGCLPLFHIGGLSTLFRCLEAGAEWRLHPAYDAGKLAGALSEGQASHVSLVPAMLAQLVDAEVVPHPRLRCVLVGGASLPAATAERAIAAGWPIFPSYGMSEAASQVATCLDGRSWQPGLAGNPLQGVEIASGADGRIKVRGPTVMAGYVNARRTPGDGLTDDGWFVTSDLGGLDEAGRLWVHGRADDMLISGGENIQPLDIEHLASRCPGVRGVGIAGRPDPVWGDLLVAFVAGETGAEDFLAWCRANLPSHQRPRQVVLVDALPLNASGKLDRRRLRELASQGEPQA